MTKPSTIAALQSLKIGSDCARALDALPGIFDEVVPLTQKHRQELGHTVRSLWEDLTSEKEHRAAEYLSSPAYYSAYVRYFLPWNIIRLSSIFGSLPLDLKDGATIVDIGSGPLTVPIALYIARPDLRARKLTIYCADKTERILKVGQNVFESLCVRLSGTLPPWTIVTLHQQFGAHLPEKADLLTGANVFNEFFWKSKAPLGMRALLTARQLLGYLKDSGSIFLMEPGDPRSGSFISSIRAALAAFGAMPVAPCPHGRACPMPGLFRSLATPGSEPPPGASAKNLSDVLMPKHRDKYPWCHFTIGTESAPKWLKALSDEAGLPKEKLVFSYLLASIPDLPLQGPLPSLAKKLPAKIGLLRVVSEEFPLPGRRLGRYACSEEGYSLVSYSPLAPGFASGDLLQMPEARTLAPNSGTAPRPGPARSGPKAQKAMGRHGAENQKTHFADALNMRKGPISKPSAEARNIDQKSGAIIVSY